jgi:hypothetical protein
LNAAMDDEVLGCLHLGRARKTWSVLAGLTSPASPAERHRRD